RSAAIRRNPKPHRAFAANADTITAAVSARRSSALTGNNTCVTPQPVHRDRRGQSRTGPSGPRTCRDLARPQPASTALLHDGHHNSPAASLRSTPSRSASTVTTAPPSANRRPSRSSGQRDNGRAVASNDLITVPPRHHKQQPAPTDQDQLLSPSAQTLPPRGQPACPRTLWRAAAGCRLQ